MPRKAQEEIMSKTKRFYEELADRITSAMYEECMDMDRVYVDRCELWEDTFLQLLENPYDIYVSLYDSLSDSDPKDMPLTVKALNALEPFVIRYVERRTA